MKKLLLFLIFLGSLFTSAQTIIEGTVFDEYLEPFPNAIISSSSSNKTTSNFEGVFTLEVINLPVTLTISSLGYSSEKITITDKSNDINIILKETYALNQIIISASRIPERIMESPVTIERVGGKFINNTASPNFYEGLKNLKGINLLDNNYLTKSITSNRGFSNTDNVRFVQLIDGFDSAVPVFDYSIGNNFGVNELDVKNIEILPGAASALYGANAFNGILLATTKNPFEDQGISSYIKTGVTTQENGGNNAFYDVGLRMAHKFNDWFAGKINFNYDKAKDWQANDITNINGTGTSHNGTSTNYDGVNVYGDDYAANLIDVTFAGASFLPSNSFNSLLALDSNQNIEISRTGIKESYLTDYNVNNLKFDVSLHFKPWGEDKTEIILGSKYSIGDNVTTLSNRYIQKNSSQSQQKIEVKGNNYFVRAYYTENDAGDTFDSKLASTYINRQIASDQTYFITYLTSYYESLATNLTNDVAHNTARSLVDNLYTIDPTTEGFKEYLNEAKNTPLTEGGSKLSENSGYYHVDANYNFTDKIEFADIQIGGNFRSFALDSDGQIYTDYDGILRYRQYGLYTQLQKKFAEDRLKISGTARFDKSKNFNGNVTPRVTLSYAAGDKKDHNFRIGFQTGFRNPTSQDQYSGITLGGNTVLLGSVQDNLDRYEITPENGNGIILAGNDAFQNSITASSLDDFQNNFRANFLENPTDLLNSPDDISVLLSYINPNLLSVSNFEKVQPEIVKSFELGYRGAIDFTGNLLEFDLVGYYNLHEDFITSTEVVVPYSGNVNNIDAILLESLLEENFQRFIISTNAKSRINAFGFAAGFNTKVFGDFNLGGSYAFSDFTIDNTDNDIDFSPDFNTPKHTVKIQFGNSKLYKNLGFGIDTRWQSEYLYQTRFLDRTLPSTFIVDAQLNYNLPSIKSTIKIGGTNITGKEYNSVPEAGTIGSQYFISWTYNN